MRVSMKYNASPTSCEIFADGEVEDYTVNITSVAREIESSETLSISVYPNPVNGDILYISPIENATYKVLNMVGQEIAKGNITNNEITVANISAGTYLLEVTTNEKSVVKRFIKQ